MAVATKSSSIAPETRPPTDRQAVLARYESAFSDRTSPFAFVDLDAMWSNADDMLRRAGSMPIRVASKSLRVRALLRQILDRERRFSGLMTFTLAESLWLAGHGFDDILLAYPTTDAVALAEWAALDTDSGPVVMVDSAAHLDYITAVASKPRHKLRVCVDVDMSYRRLGGRLRFGPLRSPLQSTEKVLALIGEISRRPAFELAGLMGYEGHVAGVGDTPVGQPLRAKALPAMQKRWVADVREHRARVVDAALQVAPLPIVNAGGTGSLHLSSTEPVVTEVTAGSGFFAPTLFDTYSTFTLTPAAFFVLPVVRKPAPELATVLGGGYIASGATGKDRLPTPWLPGGLKLDPMEGAGEVQTPLHGEPAARLKIGDRVYFRHAKAGELCERFNSVLLLSGGEIVDEVLTYRGEGQAFL